mmetsp:Transcript_13627/g.39070  ORF Transcript_13627/g.39070 Transcript_13627/m.39070 type:complete len:273 (-) Transcript_13627:15-833(-)
MRLIWPATTAPISTASASTTPADHALDANVHHTVPSQELRYAGLHQMLAHLKVSSLGHHLHGSVARILIERRDLTSNAIAHKVNGEGHRRTLSRRYRQDLVGGIGHLRFGCQGVFSAAHASTLHLIAPRPADLHRMHRELVDQQTDLLDREGHGELLLPLPIAAATVSPARGRGEAEHHFAPSVERDAVATGRLERRQEWLERQEGVGTEDGVRGEGPAGRSAAAAAATAAVVLRGLEGASRGAVRPPCRAGYGAQFPIRVHAHCHTVSIGS